MADKENSPARIQVFVELLKYPILVFSLLIAVIIAKQTLGIEFGLVTELGTQGIKFAETDQELLSLVTSLESRINVLEQSTAQEAPETTEAQKKINEEVKVSASQTVSDQTAKVSRLASSVEQSLTPATSQDSERAVQGWIWIGNYDTSWSKAQLGDASNGEPVTIAPDDMVEEETYMALGNLVVRDDLPKNDDAYYKGRAAIGVISRGSTVKILRSPIGIDREYSVQYWARVQLVSD